MEYFAKTFKWFKREIAKQGRSKKWLRRVHAVFNRQIRLNNERDVGRGVFVDLPKGELRIRRIIRGRAVVVKLTEEEIKIYPPEAGGRRRVGVRTSLDRREAPLRRLDV